MRLNTHLNLNAEGRISGTIPPLPICLHGAVLKQQADNFVFNLLHKEDRQIDRQTDRQTH